MDDLRRNPGRIGATKDESQQSIINSAPASAPAHRKSILYTILYVLRQILELPTTAILLGFGFIIPELHASIKSIGMGKSFNPERDIGNLSGKVILVTGGMFNLHHIQHLHSDNLRQAMPA